MKVLFLDIDGVVNSGWSEKQPGGLAADGFERTPDPLAIEILRPLFYDTDIHTVISSDWRWEFSVEEFQEMFPDFRVVGATKRTIDQNGNGLYGPNYRWEEITTYVEDHPDITNWAVIDDIVFRHRNAVLTHDSHGIRPKHVKRLQEILNRESK